MLTGGWPEIRELGMHVIKRARIGGTTSRKRKRKCEREREREREREKVPRHVMEDLDGTS